jgi:hypothetical protein
MRSEARRFNGVSVKLCAFVRALVKQASATRERRSARRRVKPVLCCEYDSDTVLEGISFDEYRETAPGRVTARSSLFLITKMLPEF